MAKKHTPDFDLFQFYSHVLIILYLCIGFIPNLQAVDKIAPQWVAMAVLNLISISTFFFFRNKSTFCHLALTTILFIHAKESFS